MSDADATVTGMNRPQKVTLAVSALVLAGIAALTAPAFASLAPTASEPTPVSTEAVTILDDGTRIEGGIAYQREVATSYPRCIVVKSYEATGDGWNITGGHLVEDNGPGDLANGSASADGKSYTVAEGDALIGIGDRFCVDADSLVAVNGITDIHPGDVLELYPTS